MIKALLALIQVIVLALIAFLGRDLNEERGSLFYTLKESYYDTFSPNRLYEISYYLRSDIKDASIKEGFKANEEALDFYIEGRERFRAQPYLNESYDLMVVSFYLSKPINEKKVYLELEYQKNTYELLLGSFSIEAKSYTNLFSLNVEVYYQYLNNNLLPVGIMLEALEDIKATEIKINQETYVNLSLKGIKKPGFTVLDNDYEFKNSYEEASLDLKKGERAFLNIYYANYNLPNKIRLYLKADRDYMVDLPLGLISYKRLQDYPSFVEDCYDKA